MRDMARRQGAAASTAGHPRFSCFHREPSSRSIEAGVVIGLGGAVKAGFSEFMEAERITAQTKRWPEVDGGSEDVGHG
jgi:hypothetical protein